MRLAATMLAAILFVGSTYRIGRPRGMRPLSKISADWWDYTTLDKDLLDEAARLTAADLGKLAEEVFRRVLERVG